MNNIRKMRIIVRIVRKSSLLDVLLAKTKQQILAATVLQPDRSWYLLELARHLGVRPSTLQRELSQLTDAGILKRQQNGNRVYYQADTECPVFPELGQLLFKTVGAVEGLRKLLEPLHNQIDLAFVYGSVASASERSSSDIDLMVIGSAALSRISPLLRDLERQVGRAINPRVYKREEFVRQMRDGNHFLTSVLRKDLIFITGDKDDLAKLAASAEDKTPPHERTGTRGSAKSR
jgi:DNA-binding transcriptional ArsR family regulator